MAFLLINLFFVKFVFAQHIIDKVDLAETFINYEYNTFNSADKIDKKFKSLFKTEKGVDLSMANPEQEYNRTDVTVNGLYDKRLIIIGKSPNGMNFILYENGGNALYNICLIFKETKKRYYSVSVLRLAPEINSIEKLREATKSKDYTILNE